MTRTIRLPASICFVFLQQAFQAEGLPNFYVDDSMPGQTDPGEVKVKCISYYADIFEKVNLDGAKQNRCIESCQQRAKAEVNLNAFYAMYTADKSSDGTLTAYQTNSIENGGGITGKYEIRANEYMGDFQTDLNRAKLYVDYELETLSNSVANFWSDYAAFFETEENETTGTTSFKSTPAAIQCHEDLFEAYLANNVKAPVAQDMSEAANDRMTLEGELRAKIKKYNKMNKWNSDITNPNSPSEVKGELDLANTMQSGIEAEVAPWITRELVKVLGYIAKAEKWVETLFPTPTGGNEAQRIQHETKLAVPQYIQTMGLLGSLDVVLAEETKRRVDQINGLRPVLLTAESLTTEIGFLVNAESNVSGSLYDGIKSRGIANVTRLIGQLNGSVDTLEAKLAEMNTDFLTTNEASIKQLEDYMIYTDGALSAKVVAATDRSETDLVVDEQTVTILEGTIKLLLTELEKKADVLVSLLEDVAEAREDLDSESWAALKAVNDAAPVALDKVNLAADQAYDHRESLAGTVPVAKDDAERSIKEYYDLVDGSTDSKAASTDEELGKIAGTVSDATTGLNAELQNLIVETDELLGERQSNWDHFHTANEDVLGQWAVTRSSMEGWYADFNTSVHDESVAADADAEDANSKLTGGLVEYKNTLDNFENIGGAEIAEIVEYVSGMQIRSTNDMLQELSSIGVVSADELDGLVNLTDDALFGIYNTMVPQARQSLQDAWQFNENAADFIVNRTLEDLAAVSPEVNELEGSFADNVTTEMGRVKDELYSSVTDRETELGGYFDEVTKLVTDAQDEVRKSGGNVVMYMNEAHKDWRALHGSLLNYTKLLHDSSNGFNSDLFIEGEELDKVLSGEMEDVDATDSHSVDIVANATGTIANMGTSGEETINVDGSQAAIEVANIVENLDTYLATHAHAGTNLDAAETGAEEVGSGEENLEETSSLGNHAITVADQNCTEMIRRLQEMFEANKGSVQSTIDDFTETFANDADGVFSNATWQALNAIAAAGSSTGWVLNDAGKVVGVGVDELNGLLQTFGLAYNDVSNIIEAEVSESDHIAVNITSTLYRDIRLLKAILTTFAAGASSDEDMYMSETEKDRLAMREFLNASKTVVSSLLNKLTSVNDSVHMEDFNYDMSSKLSILETNLSDVNASLDGDLWSLSRIQALLNSSTADFEGRTRTFLTTTNALEDRAARTEITAMQTLSNELYTSREAVDNAATNFAKETSSVFGKVNATLHTLSILHGATEAQVEKDISTLQKNLGDADWALARAFELEEYQGNETLERLEDDINGLDENVTQFKKWRQLAEADWEAWKNKTANAFTSVGEALDLTQLEEEDEQAAEKFAVQQALNHLSSHFSTELASMSADAHGVLTKYTAEAGVEIRQLMQNKQLSEQDKARKLAEIKEKLRLKALMVLRGGFAGRLENAALERKLQSAGSEVESAIRRMSLLYTVGHSTSPEDVNQMLLSLRSDVNDAESNALSSNGGLPSSMMERAQQHESASAVQSSMENPGAVAADRELANRDARLEKALLTMLPQMREA